jgi:hypothetical protein
MKAGRYNGFSFVQGDTFTTAPVWKINGTPVSVTDYTARMSLRKSPNSSTSVFDFTTANGRIVTGGVDGKFTISASSSDTATVAAGSYYYDLEVTSPASVRTTLLSGMFTVVKQVTV